MKVSERDDLELQGLDRGRNISGLLLVVCSKENVFPALVILSVFSLELIAL